MEAVMRKLLGINDLKKYLNSKEWDDDAILTIFNINEGTRHDVFVDNLDDSWINENLFLDINVEGI